MNYDNYETAKNWEEEQFGKFCKYDALYYRAELKSGLNNKSLKGLKILEIGFGNGGFLGWCQSLSIEAVGVELNPTLVSRGRHHGMNVYNSINEIPSQKFDVVLAIDVLEHIKRDDLVEFLKALHLICNDNATLIFRFPNGDNPFAYYLQNGDVTHQTAIGSAMITQLAALSGYYIHQIHGTATPIIGMGFMRVAKVLIGSAIRNALGFVIELTLMGGRKISWSSSIVAVLKK